ncbi:stage II sporulation protein M [Chitinophaga ginsengisegetis]|uniref:stage II sporulation protein M n=1 Tax=Chitinophaga ginsengisegetis TaxID=393003 RepID=UPI000DBA7043|nr:stage II sporulation protein M [Chitinophaga ginsengisegetis]MDR6566833.1 putative membrane protein SpoIIM required for sporulation [Chitinophaga ginsengisegetis]MDR6646563.1 putative membrane protein SpoIIM required for sporulation [Chitinophaga ginsengisegetis]MDR6652913.1 putative membrane protein SpoIIM required for sporulation [Chitinophaga ginsengisegetis]
MRESLFIKKNLSRWKKYQEEPTDDPDEMAERFVSLLDDLSYAKTFYSFSKVTRYINGLAAGIYHRIYQNRKEDVGRFQLFFKYELPLLFRKHHRLLLFTLCFFLLFCIIGAFSSAHDETFVRGVLGDEYVNMTERNIANKDPFGVYKDGNPILMFFRIAYNNIMVSFYCYIGGIFLGVGSLYLLVRNGVMLGVFQYIFFSHGLGWKSILVIWIHGTLEISSIVIAACAGIIMGKSILFPGTRKRIDSLRKGAKDGIKIMVTLIPVFIVAAFLESFVTRYTEMPLVVSLFILLASLAFILGYFIFYPIYLHKKGYRLSAEGKVLTPFILSKQ